MTGLVYHVVHGGSEQELLTLNIHGPCGLDCTVYSKLDENF